MTEGRRCDVLGQYCLAIVVVVSCLASLLTQSSQANVVSSVPARCFHLTDPQPRSQQLMSKLAQAICHSRSSGHSDSGSGGWRPPAGHRGSIVDLYERYQSENLGSSGHSARPSDYSDGEFTDHPYPHSIVTYFWECHIQVLLHVRILWGLLG